MILSRTSSCCRRARHSRPLRPVTTSTNHSDGKRSPTQSPVPSFSTSSITARNCSWSSELHISPNAAFPVTEFEHSTSSLRRSNGWPPLLASRTLLTRDMVSLSLTSENCLTFRSLSSSAAQIFRSVRQYAPYGAKATSRFP
uniref:Uncharacterized protein n=1 Tax=Triticum urartu TaxID=4572 RepID=A0A8R7RAG6_TRIUA